MEEKGKWILTQVSLHVLGNEFKHSEGPRAELFSSREAGWPGLGASFMGARSWRESKSTSFEGRHFPSSLQPPTQHSSAWGLRVAGNIPVKHLLRRQTHRYTERESFLKHHLGEPKMLCLKQLWMTFGEAWGLKPMTAAPADKNIRLPQQLEGLGSFWIPGNTDNFSILASFDHSQISKFLQTGRPCF